MANPDGVAQHRCTFVESSASSLKGFWCVSERLAELNIAMVAGVRLRPHVRAAFQQSPCIVMLKGGGEPPKATTAVGIEFPKAKQHSGGSEGGKYLRVSGYAMHLPLTLKLSWNRMKVLTIFATRRCFDM